MISPARVALRLQLLLRQPPTSPSGQHLAIIVEPQHRKDRAIGHAQESFIIISQRLSSFHRFEVSTCPYERRRNIASTGLTLRLSKRAHFSMALSLDVYGLRTFEAILHINIDGAKKRKRIGTLLDSSGGYSGGAEVSKEERKLIAHRGQVSGESYRPLYKEAPFRGLIKLVGIIIPEIPIIITLEPQNSAYVYLGHRSENRALFPSILSKIRIYPGQKSPENEKYPFLGPVE